MTRSFVVFTTLYKSRSYEQTDSYTSMIENTKILWMLTRWNL